jgi:hypothetical protein
MASAPCAKLRKRKTMKAGEIFTTELVGAVGIIFVGALIALVAVYFLWE